MSCRRVANTLWVISLLTVMSCSDATDADQNDPIAKVTTEVTPRPMPSIALEDVPVGDVPLTNVDQVVANMQLAALHSNGYRGQNLTIAILDNGFMGVNLARGKRLPPDVELVKAPGNQMQETEHGTKMAEIAYAAATGSARYVAGRPGPQMILLNTNGFTNLKWAIDEVIRRNVDIVLYAQVWEYGGNVDGEGFINAEVQRALNAGVLWINAAGNMGLATYAGDIAIDEHLKVQLPHLGQYVRFNVPQDYTPVKIVLAWNDFTNSPEHKTRQDLDLILENDKGEVLDAARLLQEGRAPKGDARYSAHARELLRQTLAKGRYRLRVQAKSNNFDAESRLRITVDGLGVTMLDRSVDQSVLMPADHKGVLAVGASDTAISGEASSFTGDHKPEIKIDSEVIFADGSRFYGTSAASAIATGSMAAYMSASGLRTREQLLQSSYLQPWLNQATP